MGLMYTDDAKSMVSSSSTGVGSPFQTRLASWMQHNQVHLYRSQVALSSKHARSLPSIKIHILCMLISLTFYFVIK